MTEQSLWQAYCALKAHLKVLTKVTLEENSSAAMQFAIQTEGIIEFAEKDAKIYPYNK